MALLALNKQITGSWELVRGTVRDDLDQIETVLNRKWSSTLGGLGLGSFTDGSVLFAESGTFAQDHSNFFWDSTNHRLGIGTTAPAQALHITDPSDLAVFVENGGIDAGVAQIHGRIQLGSFNGPLGTTGLLQLPHGTQVTARNSTNTQDVLLLDWGSSYTDTLVIGGFAPPPNDTFFFANTTQKWYLGGNNPSNLMMRLSQISGAATELALGPFLSGSGTGIGFGVKPDETRGDGRISVLSSSSNDNLVLNGKGSGSVFFNLDALNANVQVLGASQTVASDTYNLYVKSLSAFAIDKGGSLGFSGIYSSGGSQTTFGAIAGRKENSTDGDLAGYLQFYTRAAASGAPVEAMRITSTGLIGIGGVPTYDVDIIKSVAGPLGFRAKNTSTSAGNVHASVFVENSSSYGQLFKAGTSYSSYKNIAAGDLGFYNVTAGNISILNDSGNINLGANGSSAAQVVIDTNGLSAAVASMVYSTTTFSGSYDRLRSYWDGAQFNIFSEHGGGGGAAQIRIGCGTTSVWVMDTSGNLATSNSGGSAALVLGQTGFLKFGSSTGLFYFPNTGKLRLTDGSAVAGVLLDLTTNGSVTVRKQDDSADGQLAAASVRGNAVTFANVPASPVEGMVVAVTDSNTNVWGAAIAGGGANHVLAYYNGTNWTVIGK